MINEEKVIMMTKLASYESGEGKKDISILNYFRNDYIGFQLLKSVISATISFLAIFAVYAFYKHFVLKKSLLLQTVLLLPVLFIIFHTALKVKKSAG